MPAAGWGILGVCIVFFLLSLFFPPHIRKKPARHHLGGKILYADQKATAKNPQFGTLLQAEGCGLSGKPDYVLTNLFGNLVPVEMKSGRIKNAPHPHPGDLIQLGAYFLILEELYEKRPRYGILMYKDYQFIIKNTASLRKEVLYTAQAMRAMQKNGQGEANPSFVKCRYCICRGTVCEYCEESA